VAHGNAISRYSLFKRFTPLPSIRRSRCFQTQVNPHFQPMLYATHGAAGEPCRWAPRGAAEAGWRGGFVLAALELFLRSDMSAKLQFLRDVDATPGWSGRVFTQSTGGTITITPALYLRDYFLLLSNPTNGNIGRYTREGQIATYSWRCRNNKKWVTDDPLWRAVTVTQFQRIRLSNSKSAQAMTSVWK